MDPATRRGRPAIARLQCHAVHGWRAAVLALALPLGGCMTVPPRPLDPVAMHEAFAARTLDDSALEARLAAAFPQLSRSAPRWDRARLVATAWLLDPGLAAARAEVAAAVAERGEAGLRDPATLALDIEHARRERSPWLYGLGLEWPLGGATRRRLAREAGDLDIAAARARLVGEAWRVRARVVAALSADIAAQHDVEVHESLVDVQRARAALAARRVAAGEDATSDALPAREAALAAETALGEARMGRVRARGEFAAAIGVPVDALVVLDPVAAAWADWGSPAPFDDADLDTERERALLARSDMAEAIQAYALAENALQQAVADQFPRFTVSPGYAWDHGIAKLPLGLDVTLPQPRRDRARIARLEAERERAGQALVGTQAGIHAAIDTARSAERAARDNLDAARRRHDAIRVDGERHARALHLGAIDRTEVLAVDVLTAEAARDVVTAQRALQEARLALEDAVHVPLSGPERGLAWPTEPEEPR